jgi:two-component system, OmpR family, KDP operon response regulator KdpE
VSARILVVDDEPQLRRFLKTALEAHSYTVDLATTGREALELAQALHPDVVLLDLGLPELDGLEVCRRIRAYSQLPIIVISARDREQDKVTALNEGADDYLTKPFGTGELLARIQVALRHVAQVQPAARAQVAVGSLRLDLTMRQVFVRGEEVHLTPTEYEILKALARRHGQVLTQSALAREVWGPGEQHNTSKLRVFINQLRRKIEDDPAQPAYIITEPGVGYRLRAEL